ncbi:MAG: class I SAM-dependent rRNA methyltransferase [Planctomycetota bacterium]
MPGPLPVAPHELRLTPRASGFARRGQPWFYADDVLAGAPLPPRLVRVRDEDGRDLGLGITGPSKLALRLCGPWPGDDVPDRATFFAARLAAAIDARAGSLGPEDGVRLVHGEGDLLPGLVVDRYGPLLVLQVTSAWVETALDAIVPCLVDRLGADSVVARNDVPARRREGLPEEVRLLHGRRLDQVAFREHGVAHDVRPFTGHKTGFYLDQRDNRALLRDLAEGREVLDCFCYSGGFAVNALAAGAAHVTAIDSSGEAIAAARRHIRMNALSEARVDLIEGDVFQQLRRFRDQGRRFDIIVLDPPKFAPTAAHVERAARAYKDINLWALRLLRPGGLLFTFSCSGGVPRELFQKIVAGAAVDAQADARILHHMGAAADHPVALAFPEGDYLKGLLCQTV